MDEDQKYSVEAIILKTVVIDNVQYDPGDILAVPKSWGVAMRRDLETSGKVRFQLGALLHA
jgi:hypothetical protein